MTGVRPSLPPPPLPSHSTHHRPIRPNSGGSRNLGAGPVRGPHREPIEGKRGTRQRWQPEGGLVAGRDLRGEEEAALARPVPSGTAALSSALSGTWNQVDDKQNWVQRRAGWRQRGIAKVWFTPSAKRRCAEGPGKDDRGIATGQETGADAEHSARDWPLCSLSIVAALPGGCVLVAFALLCVVHVVRATCMSVVVGRELVDPDNPLSFCSLFPSFGVTPPPRAPLFRRSTVFCLLARPFGACRPLPAEGPPNVFCPGRPRGGAKAASPHPQQRPHHDDRAVDESVRWPPERSRFRPALWGADRVLGTVIGLFGGFDAMSRRLADVLRGPLVPVVVVGMARRP